MTFYDILEVSPDASPEVLRAAYRSLSRKYHPDSNPDSDEAKHFQQVQEAWEVLRDPQKRRHYDEHLRKSARSAAESTGTRRDSANGGTEQPPSDPTVMKVDGTSTFLTVAEHFKRKWKEAAGCDLSGMTFDGVSFRGAILTGAKLDGSSFVGCDFRDADLCRISAQNCDFRSAQFDSSDIRNVDLSTSNLVNADLHKVKYDSRTIFPDGYPIPSDAVDMGAELRAKQFTEVKRKIKQAGFFAVSSFRAISFGLPLAVIGFLIWSEQQPDNNGITLPENPKVTLTMKAQLEKLRAGLEVNEQGEIVEVDLNYTQITDAGLVHLAGLTSLQTLALFNTQVTDAGLRHLKGLTSLQTLGLSNTQITDAGLVHLAGLTSLQGLNLSGTKITDAGLVHLKGLTSLQKLGLSNTQITNRGLVHLAGLTSLQELYLNSTQITDAGLVQLAGLTSLQTLRLSNTEITDAGLVHLSGLTSLQRLALSETQVTDAGVAKLKEALPNWEISR